MLIRFNATTIRMVNSKNLLILITFFLLILPQISCRNQQDIIDTKITLHIIPHTHDDAGWLSTVDEYYTGEGTPFRECVKCILDSMYEILMEKNTRIFNYVEMVFFSRWYYSQTKEVQENVKKLVKNGQLAFMNGGWVMNDEATTYYDDMIEQLILGHAFLKKEFDFLPTIGWQIDPFGHSATQASIFSQVGFKMFFLERIDYQDFDRRKYEQNLEFIWKSLGTQDENYILTHINYFKYGGNWVMDYCMPDNICDGRITNTNLTTAVQWIRDQLNYFQTSQILWQIGSDFSFSTEPFELYEYIEDLQKQINSNPRYKVKAEIDTLDEYANKWYNEYSNNKDIELTIKKDDFFPYSDRANILNEPSYWTGYFTSKPSFKYLIKKTSQFLHGIRKFYAQYLLNNPTSLDFEEDFQKIDEKLTILEKAVSVCQHHDASTGTAKQLVMVDYMMQLLNATEENMQLYISLSNPDTKKYIGEDLTWTTCMQNMSSISCQNLFEKLNTKNDSIVLKIFNPDDSGIQIIRAKIPHEAFEVIDDTNKIIPSDKICYSDAYYSSESESESESSTIMEDCDIYFKDYFGSLQTKYYKLIHVDNPTKPTFETLTDKQKSKTLIIDDLTRLIIHDNSNIFTYIHCTGKIDNKCIKHKFNLEYHFYKSFHDQPNPSQPIANYHPTMGVMGIGQKSGAYIFRPLTSKTYLYAPVYQINITEGDVLTEIRVI